MEGKRRELRLYSEDFKLMVISEIKAGLSVIEVSDKYDIRGSMTVYKWCKKFKVKPQKRITIDVPLNLKEGEKEMSKEKKKIQGTKEQSDYIKLLEYELTLYKKLVEIAKRDYDLDLVKKSNTKPFKK